MTMIGGVWLFVVVLGLDGPQPTIQYQRRYDSMVQCQQAKAEVLRRYPHAYARCD